MKKGAGKKPNPFYSTAEQMCSVVQPWSLSFQILELVKVHDSPYLACSFPTQTETQAGRGWLASRSCMK